MAWEKKDRMRRIFRCQLSQIHLSAFRNVILCIISYDIRQDRKLYPEYVQDMELDKFEYIKTPYTAKDANSKLSQ